MKENIGNLNEVRAIMVFLVMTMGDQFEVEFDVSLIECYSMFSMVDKVNLLYSLQTLQESV
ncbi:hypothetical protein ACWFRC_23250 [Bacillus cereus]